MSIYLSINIDFLFKIVIIDSNRRTNKMYKNIEENLKKKFGEKAGDDFKKIVGADYESEQTKDIQIEDDEDLPRRKTKEELEEEKEINEYVRKALSSKYFSVDVAVYKAEMEKMETEYIKRVGKSSVESNAWFLENLDPLSQLFIYKAANELKFNLDDLRKEALIQDFMLKNMSVMADTTIGLIYEKGLYTADMINEAHTKLNSVNTQLLDETVKVLDKLPSLISELKSSELSIKNYIDKSIKDLLDLANKGKTDYLKLVNDESTQNKISEAVALKSQKYIDVAVKKEIASSKRRNFVSLIISVGVGIIIGMLF